MSAAVVVIISGLVILVVLAVIIGSIERESQAAAWRRIAAARREIADARRQMNAERELMWAEFDRARCQVCPFRQDVFATIPTAPGE